MIHLFFCVDCYYNGVGLLCLLDGGGGEWGVWRSMMLVSLFSVFDPVSFFSLELNWLVFLVPMITLGSFFGCGGLFVVGNLFISVVGSMLKGVSEGSWFI